MSQFFTLLTAIGAAEHANAHAANTTVPYTHLAIDDGNGAEIVPTEAMTAPVHEVARVAISSVTADPDNPNWFIIEGVLPANIGGWTVRGFAVIGGAGAGGKVLFVGNLPASYKPQLSEGSARDMIVRVVVQVSNAGTVQLVLNPNTAIATNQSVANAIAQHEAKADPHPQYLTGPEGAALIAAHEAAVDPHPQYLIPRHRQLYLSQ